jgi:hypothetical protein
MDKLSIIEFLLQEVKEELELLAEFQAFRKDNKDWWKWTKRFPKKALIKSNLLKIRKLTLKITKEVE